MSIIKKIAGFVTQTQLTSNRAYTVLVACDRCGEKIKTRVHLFNDLSAEYGKGKHAKTYFARKTIVGNRKCFSPITVELVFNSRRHLIRRSIVGGRFLSEEEFNQEERAASGEGSP